MKSLREYTRQLIASAPSLTDNLDERHSMIGSPPDLLTLPQGCCFSPRCTLYCPTCLGDRPIEVDIGNGRTVSCFHWNEVMEKGEMRNGKQK